MVLKLLKKKVAAAVEAIWAALPSQLRAIHQGPRLAAEEFRAAARADIRPTAAITNAALARPRERFPEIDLGSHRLRGGGCT